MPRTKAATKRRGPAKAAKPKPRISGTRKPPTAKRPSTKPASKKDAVLILLSRKTGASLDELMTATGWQAHSIRGCLSGTIGKKLGLKVHSSVDASGARRYAIKR